MLKTIKFRNGMEVQKNLCGTLHMTIRDKITENFLNKTVTDSPLTITHKDAYDLIMREDTRVIEGEESIEVSTKDVSYYIQKHKR